MSDLSPDGVIIRAMQESDLVGVGEMTFTTYIPYEEPNSPYLDILRDWRLAFGSDRTFRSGRCSNWRDSRGGYSGSRGSPWAAIAADDEIEMRMLAVDESARAEELVLLLFGNVRICCSEWLSTVGAVQSRHYDERPPHLRKGRFQARSPLDSGTLFPASRFAVTCGLFLLQRGSMCSAAITPVH
ncbi:MAG: hypothetical protein U1U88_000380, partial [Lawsonella clevelandensis]